MTDLINASPLLILVVLVILAWFLDSKILRLATAGFFFLYPVILGKVSLPTDPSQIPNYVFNVVRYWLTGALDALVHYIKQRISSF